MLSSINKDLNFDWKDDRYQDYQEENTQFFDLPNTENLVNKLNTNIAKSAPKKEINLPKTKLTRKGQLFLYTNGKESEGKEFLHEDNQNQLSSMLSKNLIKKSYSKKWIDDVSQDFSIDSNKFLDEKIDESLNMVVNNRNSSISGKVGKNTEYFIHDLKVKSGKDRCLQKASYLEFLPSDFDSKNELADALKSLNSTNKTYTTTTATTTNNNNNTNTHYNAERVISSRQTGNSAFSFFNDIADCNSSDDERFEKATSHQQSNNISRLSSQPVLSAQSLINRLNCTSNTGYIINNENRKQDSDDKNDSGLDSHKEESNLTINYKDVFIYEDTTTEKNHLNYMKKHINELNQQSENKNENKGSTYDPNKYTVEHKKILEKRLEKRRNNSPIVGVNTENLETISLKSSRKNSMTPNKPRMHPHNNSPIIAKTNLSAGNRRNQSPKYDNATPDSNMLDPLTVIGSKRLENEENLPTLFNTRASFYSSFINNRNPATPIPPYDKILIANNQAMKQQVYFRPPIQEDNLEPITISVTEIENEVTGNSIKIRRFFDRQAMRIKKIPMAKDEYKNNSAKLNKLRRKQLIEACVEPIDTISGFNFKLENLDKRSSSRRSSFKSTVSSGNYDSASNYNDSDDQNEFKGIKIKSEKKSSLKDKSLSSSKSKKSSDTKHKDKVSLERQRKDSTDSRIKSATQRDSSRLNKKHSKNDGKKSDRSVKSTSSKEDSPSESSKLANIQPVTETKMDIVKADKESTQGKVKEKIKEKLDTKVHEKEHEQEKYEKVQESAPENISEKLSARSREENIEKDKENIVEIVDTNEIVKNDMEITDDQVVNKYDNEKLKESSETKEKDDQKIETNVEMRNYDINEMEVLNIKTKTNVVIDAPDNEFQDSDYKTYERNDENLYQVPKNISRKSTPDYLVLNRNVSPVITTDQNLLSPSVRKKSDSSINTSISHQDESLSSTEEKMDQYQKENSDSNKLIINLDIEKENQTESEVDQKVKKELEDKTETVNQQENIDDKTEKLLLSTEKSSANEASTLKEVATENLNKQKDDLEDETTYDDTKLFTVRSDATVDSIRVSSKIDFTDSNKINNNNNQDKLDEIPQSEVEITNTKESTFTEITQELQDTYRDNETFTEDLDLKQDLDQPDSDKPIGVIREMNVDLTDQTLNLKEDITDSIETKTQEVGTEENQQSIKLEEETDTYRLDTEEATSHDHTEEPKSYDNTEDPKSYDNTEEPSVSESGLKLNFMHEQDDDEYEDDDDTDIDPTYIEVKVKDKNSIVESPSREEYVINLQSNMVREKNIEEQEPKIKEIKTEVKKMEKRDSIISIGKNESSTTKPTGKKVEFSDKVMEQIISDNPKVEETKITNLSDKNPIVQPIQTSDPGTKKPEPPTKSKKEDTKSSITPSKPVSKPTVSKPPTQKSKSPVKVTDPKQDKKSDKTEKTDTKSDKKAEIKTETSQEEVPKPADKATSLLDALLGEGKEEEKVVVEEKPPEPPKERSFVRKERIKHLQYLNIPWDSKEPIVDYEAYHKTFQIPEVLCPQLHNIDPISTSVEELILERRILEDKILELRNEKLAILNMTSEERAKLQKRPDKKKGKTRKLEKVDTKKLKETEMKERIIKEERLRLHNEALKKQIEREKIGNVMIQNIEDKNNEIENLTNELDKNTKEFNQQYNSVVEQINYLEGSEDQIREALANARLELRERISKNQAEKRRFLRQLQEEKREQKMFDFNIKAKELSWLLDMYNDPEEVSKIKTKQAELEQEKEQWLYNFENDCMDQEKEMDDEEEEEENRLTAMEQEEEENSLVSIRQEQFEMLQEKKNLVERFEEIKLKITNRIQQVIEEKKMIEEEKRKFDEDYLANIEKQREKLIEILEAEHNAKETIRHDLEEYHRSLMKMREKNLEMRCSLAFMNHSHNVSKPFVFSYVVHWPLDSFSKPFGQDKKKMGPKPKK